MKPVTSRKLWNAGVFFPPRHKELCVKQTKTYGVEDYNQGIFLVQYWIPEAQRFSKVVAGWFVYTGLRQTTIRNFSQDKSSHIWTVTNAFQVKIWNGGWQLLVLGFFFFSLKSQTPRRPKKVLSVWFFVLFASQLPCCEYFVHQYKSSLAFFAQQE